MNRRRLTGTLTTFLVLGSLLAIPLLAGTGVGERAKDFKLAVVGAKKSLALSSLKGHPTLLVFWATWCPPCRREIPQLVKVREKYGRKGLKIVAVAINYRETRNLVDKFRRAYKLPYTILWDKGNKISSAYAIKGVPTSILIDGEGVIRFRGYRLDASFYELLNKMTGVKPAASPAKSR